VGQAIHHIALENFPELLDAMRGEHRARLKDATLFNNSVTAETPAKEQDNG